MVNNPNKRFDLEGRCLEFAKRVNKYANNLPRTISNLENAKQLARSGGSIGANYIEANESLGKKDFCLRIKIAKKEAKESIFWLELTSPGAGLEKERTYLINEATEIMKILGAILEKSK